MVRVLFFGKLAELTGHRSTDIQAAHSTELLRTLREQYPQLSHHTMAVAVNRRLITEPVALSPGDEVAFMPPYSGG